MVAAHCDFTPWNTRVNGGDARVFDWEYASYQQLPLFDPLHFVLLAMATKSESTGSMAKAIQETLKLSRYWLGSELCYKMEAQVLAYLMSVCAFYLWSVRGKYDSHAVLDTYARLIDRLLLA
jgi:thiamine kinase-like enzyme